MYDEAAYIYDSCGEEVVIPLDLSQGQRQKLVEDCPICCRRNIIHIEVEEGGELRMWEEAE